MAVPSQLTVSEGLMGGDNYREDDGAGHYLTGGSWSNLIGILSVHCMRITQSFEYSNVIEAEGEVYTWGVGSDFWCYDLLCLLLPGHDCEASRPEQRTSDMSDGEIQDNEQIYLSSLCCLDNNVNWQLDRFRYIDTTRVILLGLTQINLLFL